jgi:hypothetical protein
MKYTNLNSANSVNIYFGQLLVVLEDRFSNMRLSKSHWYKNNRATIGGWYNDGTVGRPKENNHERSMTLKHHAFACENRFNKRDGKDKTAMADRAFMALNLLAIGRSCEIAMVMQKGLKFKEDNNMQCLNVSY